MRFEGCLFQLVLAAILACHCQLSTAYVGLGRVPVVDGKCQYNGTEIPDSETLKVEVPCEEWSCDAGEGIISITGCGTVEAGPGCYRVEGHGLHPDCCPRIACHTSPKPATLP
ncbi:complement inhibitor CirpT2-like [Haemaphysalis longicornis]